jgi:hypothetical protein
MQQPNLREEVLVSNKFLGSFFNEKVLKRIQERKEQINDEWVNKEGQELSKLQGERLALDFVLGLPEQIKSDPTENVSEEDE